MNRLVVFTDLDGTLLDHHDYSWQAARPALDALKERGYPLILNSSKTVAELTRLSTELGLASPLICENGAIVAIPHTDQPDVNTRDVTYSFKYFASPYSDITSTLQKIKREFGYQFTGFSDMTLEQIMRCTGLDRESAEAASSRQATEPLLWQDTDEALTDFRKQLDQYKLTMTRGGRFYHVMSPADKGQSIQWLVEMYQQQQPGQTITTLALGDSENDLPMLEKVDYPVLVYNPHSKQPDISHLEHARVTSQPGPQGWNNAVLDVLNTINEES